MADGVNAGDPGLPILKPLAIGAVRVAHPICLAPMAGITDAAFRGLCFEQGAGLALTEITNAEGVARRHGSSLHLLTTWPTEGVVGAHFYGSDPVIMAEAAAVAESLGRFAFVDVNAGCPVKRIVARGAGAGLTKDPDRLCRIVEAMRKATRLPVTVKTRIGFSADRVNALEVLKACEAGGAAAIFLHARVATAKHQGAPRWDLLAQVKQASSIPVIGNGGVQTGAGAADMLRQTGVDGVMIGRGAIGNPWIFREVLAAIGGREAPATTDGELRAVMAEHYRRLVWMKEHERRSRRRARFTAERGAALSFRVHLIGYLAGRRWSVDVRRNLNSLCSWDTICTAVDHVLGESPVVSGPIAPDRGILPDLPALAIRPV